MLQGGEGVCRLAQLHSDGTKMIEASSRLMEHGSWLEADWKLIGSWLSWSAWSAPFSAVSCAGFSTPAFAVLLPEEVLTSVAADCNVTERLADHLAEPASITPSSLSQSCPTVQQLTGANCTCKSSGGISRCYGWLTGVPILSDWANVMERRCWGTLAPSVGAWSNSAPQSCEVGLGPWDGVWPMEFHSSGPWERKWSAMLLSVLGLGEKPSSSWWQARDSDKVEERCKRVQLCWEQCAWELVIWKVILLTLSYVDSFQGPRDDR